MADYAEAVLFDVGVGRAQVFEEVFLVEFYDIWMPLMEISNADQDVTLNLWI